MLDPANHYVATYAYDSAGRVSVLTDATGKAARTAYNNRGQVTNQWGDTATPVAYGYDSTYGDRTTQSTYRLGSGWSGSTWPGGDPTGSCRESWINPAVFVGFAQIE